LVWVDRKGNRQPVNAPPQNYINPRVSPEGEHAAVEILPPGGRSANDSRNFDIWIVELARGTSTRLTSEGSNRWPIWTPDGRRVTFTSQRAANSGIYWAPADGSGKPELLLPEAGVPSAWTPDSQTLLYGGRGHICAAGSGPRSPGTAGRTRRARPPRTRRAPTSGGSRPGKPPRIGWRGRLDWSCQTGQGPQAGPTCTLFRSVGSSI
jgi:Tol biopolymer transport system component